MQVGERTSGAAAVVSRYLRTSWLWDKVRVVGGAYGAMNSYNPTTGMFKYVSYRDPNLLSTLKVRSLLAGTQFTCFTSTKGQILTMLSTLKTYDETSTFQLLNYLLY